MKWILLLVLVLLASFSSACGGTGTLVREDIASFEKATISATAETKDGYLIAAQASVDWALLGMPITVTVKDVVSNGENCLLVSAVVSGLKYSWVAQGDPNLCKLAQAQE